MGIKSVAVFAAAVLFLAYYCNEPVPDGITQPWVYTAMGIYFRTLGHVARLGESLGIAREPHIRRTALSGLTNIARKFKSDHRTGLKVTDTTFDGVKVRIYEPATVHSAGDRRTGLVYFHGGGWAQVTMDALDELIAHIAKQLGPGNVLVAVDYLTWPFHTFKKLGIPGPTPVVHFGNILSYSEGSHIFDSKCYKKYGKVYGFFEGRQPMLMVGDLDIIKEITVKQFHNFSNRRDLGSLLDAIAGALFVIEDEDWKRVRSAITPTFSSSKLKQMTMLVEKCGDGLVSILMERQEKGIMFDMKEVCSAYTMDVISSTAFGVEADSLHNPDHPFATHAKAIFKINIVKGFFYVILPPPFSYIFTKGGFSLLPKFATDFFKRTVEKVIKLRESNPDEDKRVDFLHLLLKAHNKSLDEKTGEGTVDKQGLSMQEIVGNSLNFWLAGYDTTANTIALTAYNLAFHQEAQDRVMEEIDTVVQNRGKLDYEALNEMRFLEMCIYETLRIYPGAKRFDRVCKEDTEVKGLYIPAGTIVNIPAYAIHHDPELWPEPEKFKPERFSKEAQETRDPYAFLPFGSGPRNCVGMRLALLEIKLALAKALEKVRFVTCEKTEVPLRLENNNGNQVIGGVWLRVEARTGAARTRMSSA